MQTTSNNVPSGATNCLGASHGAGRSWIFVWSRALFPTILILSMLAAPWKVQATSRTWTGTSGNNWSTNGNWSPAAKPVKNDSLIFSGAHTVSTNDISGLTLGTITFSTSGFTVSGNSLSLTSGISNNISAGTSAWSIGTTLTASQTFTSTYSGALLQLGNVSIGSSKTLTIAGAGDTTISGILGGSSANVIKNDTGTLTLSAANSFSGSTTISAGTLNASDNGTLGSTSSVTIGVGGTLLLSSPVASDRVNDSAAINLAGGSLVMTGGASEGYAGSDSSGSDEAPGMGALTLSANSRIDFGTGGIGDVVFDSYAFTGSSTLTIDNWSGNEGTLGISGVTDRLVFQNDPSGSIGSISFNLPTGSAPAMVIPYGAVYEVVPVGPVPEPSTALTGLTLLGFIGWRERHQLLTLRSKLAMRATRNLPI